MLLRLSTAGGAVVCSLAICLIAYLISLQTDFLKLFGLKYYNRILQQKFILDGVWSAVDDKNESFKNLFKEGSSAWCRGSNRSERLCRFKNICYYVDTGEFVFLHSEASVTVGVPVSKEKVSLVDLTSIEDLNTHYVTFVDIPVKRLNYFNVMYIKGETLILSPFKPDNIMHVFHDDLLPIFATYHELCAGNVDICAKSLHIALIENIRVGDFAFIYELMSKNDLLLSSQFNASSLYCFRSSIIGLSKYPVWYQYGFDKFQGPKLDSAVTGMFIRTFTSFFTKELLAQFTCNPKSDAYTVFLGRKITRLILNELELTVAIAKFLNQKVYTFYMEVDSIVDIICFVSHANLLIGIHGAHLILTMFLPKGATLIELFPYAVPPDDYTPYKTLTNLPGMDLTYAYWKNTNHRNSFAYPDRPPELGGISHLPEDEQQKIQGLSSIPKQKCCSSPAWLYRIYQDTVVDISSFLEILERTSINTVHPNSAKHLAISLYSSPVQNLSCKPFETDNSNFLISWDPPWNLNFIHYGKIKYEIWFHCSNLDEYKAVQTTSTYYAIHEQCAEPVYCWVSCIVNDKTSLRLWVQCVS